MSQVHEALDRCSVEAADPRVAAVVARLRAPLAVAVRGRPRVGCEAVAATLRSTGYTVAGARERADVRVVVIAEALKPEDRRCLAGPQPAIIVLNKADLAGRVSGGPIAAATRTAAGIAAATGRPVVPMVALLADVDVDDEMLTALRTLAAAPADVSSADAFVDTHHVVPAPVRRRLLERLDRFGLAHAVMAVADGLDAAALTARLRALSRTDRLRAALDDVSAEVDYRRVKGALAALARVAADTRDDALDAVLNGDELVIAVMAVAADVMVAAGLRIDPDIETDIDAYVDPQVGWLRRAVLWRRYADGPLDALHRDCAADISRGSLRLLTRFR